MKYYLPVTILSILAGIIYLLIAPQYAAACGRAPSGSVLEGIMIIPSIIFTIAGCGLSIFGVGYLINALHEEVK